MSDASPVIHGRCHVFGHDMGMDTEVLPHAYAQLYPFDAEKLKHHLFERVREGFAAQCRPGDIIVAGRNFAHGKPHPQALIAIAELGLHVLCESMPFYAYRGAISRGVLIHRDCAGVTDMVADGDIASHDFSTGAFHNETNGKSANFSPLPERLLDMIQIGGMKPMLAQWRKAQLHQHDTANTKGD
ncbi:hypothetical protein [Gymnodinialimonas sp. 57CJ19]|uniref:hypothetical protein n=1 Tax=Gymnodinialimonas sp. 57CJ19 TaxID=3138498 RepID=UPI0031343502